MNPLVPLAVAARRRPLVTALALVAITALAAFALPHVRFESDLTKLFPDADETVRTYREVSMREGGTRTLLVVLRGARVADALPSIVASLRESEFVESVTATQDEFSGGLAEFARAAPAWFVPQATLDALAARMNGDGADAALADAKARLATDPVTGRELLLRDPLGLRWILERGARDSAPFALDPGSPYLVAPGGALAVVKLIGKHEPLEIPFSQALLADVEKRVGTIGGVTFDLIGGYVVAREQEARVRGDLELSGTLSFALVALFLIVSFRAVARPSALMIGTNLAVFQALAFGGVMFGPLTPLAAGCAAILVGIGVDPAIHLLARYESERQTKDATLALSSAARASARPILLSAITVTAAFLTLAASDFRGLRGFGLVLALGLGLAVVNAFVFQPLLLRGRFDRLKREEKSATIAALARVHRSAARKPTVFLLIAAALVGWILVLSRGVPIDVGLDSLQPAKDPMETARERLEGEIGISPIPVAALVPADVSLDEIAAATARLESSGRVRASEGPHRRAKTATRAAAVTRFRESTRGWMEKELAAIERAGFARAKFEPGLAEMDRLLNADPAESASALPADRFRVVHLFPPRTLTRAPDRAAFAADVDAAFGRSVTTVSPYSLGDLLRSTFAHELKKLLLLSGAAVAALVLLLSGGVLNGLLTMIPALIAFGLALGHLALFEGRIHLGNFVALPLLAGVCVDNGIHMVATRRDKDDDPFGAAGIALWRNYATTALGFGALLMAETPGLVSLGATLLIGCSAAFLTSLLVLAPRRGSVAEDTKHTKRHEARREGQARGA